MPPLGLPSLIPFAERARNPSLVRSEIKSLSNSRQLLRLLVIESIRRLLLNRHRVIALLSNTIHRPAPLKYFHGNRGRHEFTTCSLLVFHKLRFPVRIRIV